MRTIFCLILVFLTSLLPAPLCAQSTQPSSAPASVTLRGRLLDAAGAPIPDVKITATPMALNHSLASAPGTGLSTQTDSQGRYELRLPFPELLYFIYPNKLGYAIPAQTLVAEKDQNLNFTATPVPNKANLKGEVITADEDAEPDLPLRLVGEYGFEAQTKTDRKGYFTFSGLPNYFGQGVILAQRDGKVLPLAITRADTPKKDLSFQLVPAATFKGTAVDEQDGTPLPNISIVIRPTFASGVRLTTTTDAKGQWQIPNVPPGEWIVEPEGPNHFSKPPRGYVHNRPAYKPKAGETLTVDLKLQRKATLTGTVVDRDGHPVPNAFVGTLCTWTDDDDRERTRYITTDAQGRFTLQTGHRDESLPISASHGRHGLAYLYLQPDQKPSDLRLVLPGTFRLRGTLLAADSNQLLPNVRCSPGWLNTGDIPSDHQGRFDLGRLTIPSDPKSSLLLLEPPTFPRGIRTFDEHTKTWLPMPQGTPNAVYYQKARPTFSATPDQTVDLKLTLAPTELLTLTGTLLDLAGKPIPDASVYLFPANPSNTWIKSAASDESLSDEIISIEDLGSARTTADGRFQLYALRYEGQAADTGTKYALGIVTAGKPRKLLDNVLVPKDKHELDVPITIDPQVDLKHPRPPDPHEQP